MIRDVAGAKDLSDPLSVLPCSVRIDDFDTHSRAARKGLEQGEFPPLWSRRRRAMRAWLQGSFDYTIIDCPPSLSMHVQFMLRISDAIIVPSVPDRLSVRGAMHFGKRLETRGIKTRVLGTLWTLYRAQVETHRRVISAFGPSLKGVSPIAPPFHTIIPNAAALASVSDADRPVMTLKQKYTPAFAMLYEELCDELMSGLHSPRPGPTQRELRGLGVRSAPRTLTGLRRSVPPPSPAL